MKKHALIFDVDSTLTNNRAREEFANEFVGDKTDRGGKRNESWHNMFQDGRLYHLDKPIGNARNTYLRIHRDLDHASASGAYVYIIMLSGRRDTPDNHTRFKDWLMKHSYEVPHTIIFRPVGEETDSWKHSMVETLLGQYDILAGYGNERDMPVYEKGGFEAILVDEAGNGWKMPERWDEVVKR